MIRLFYHSADLDGNSSGALLRYYHERQGLKNGVDFQLIPMDYGMKFDDNKIKNGDTVIMADVTLQPYDRMVALNNRCDLFVYDHHKSVVPILEENNIKGLYGEDSIAGCELVWLNFFNPQIPEFIKLLSTWDCWNNEDNYLWENKVKPFQMGMRSYETDPSTEEGWKFWKGWFECLNSKFESIKINGIVAEGETVIRYTNAINIDLMKRSFDITFEGLRVLAVNGYKGSPQFDSKWDESKYDAMLSFYNTNNEHWTISMYTTKDIDLSVIATKYKGGGHPRACGATLTQEQMIKLLNGDFK